MFGWGSRLTRLRHGRGFGIHSPFAFRFITEVLREKCPYYDYDSLSGRAPRLLYRVACYFYPKKIASAAGADLAPVRLACPKAVTTAVGEADFIVSTPGADPADLRRALRYGAVIYLSGSSPALFSALCAELADMGCGMTFDNQRGQAVFVPYTSLPRQDFKAKF